jgi:hypothetical protein
MKASLRCLTSNAGLSSPPKLTRASPHFSLDRPFTPLALGAIRSALSAKLKATPLPTYDDETRPRAAVLIPLCNDMEGNPSVLLEVRATTMRSHSGEIRLGLFFSTAVSTRLIEGCKLIHAAFQAARLMKYVFTVNA